MAIKIQHIRDTASNWTSNNPTPFEGELCYETDTGKIKMGDGTTAWTSLSYIGEYTVQDGQLSENNFTNADHAKLDGIPATANVTNTSSVSSAGALMRSGGTMTGDLNFVGYKETVSSHTTSFTPDLTAATIFEVNAALTLTMPTPESGRTWMVKVSTGTDVTWSGAVYWNGGGEPSKSSGVDLYTFIGCGSDWYAAQAGTGYA